MSAFWDEEAIALRGVDRIMSINLKYSSTLFYEMKSDHLVERL